MSFASRCRTSSKRLTTTRERSLQPLRQVLRPPIQQSRAGAIAPPCGGSPTAIDWSIDQIDKSVQPTDAQRSDLANVREAFGKTVDDLQAHCPAAVPPTAVARLDAIEARLDATWRSVLSIQVALANFEAKLDDAQKDHFNQMNFAAAR